MAQNNLQFVYIDIDSKIKLKIIIARSKQTNYIVLVKCICILARTRTNLYNYRNIRTCFCLRTLWSLTSFRSISFKEKCSKSLFMKLFLFQRYATRVRKFSYIEWWTVCSILFSRCPTSSFYICSQAKFVKLELFFPKYAHS